ncbi:hypothetical protein AVEN_264140-1 [Araneus ventricosus]|uniref:Mos1 transposase HTH domain-containing protein n=1 Tax=Araneus ventricosus TaxID=182803 RepID=A0A4Y2HA46_ARAVE|nr:hypothetical protein AVEN_264140-1 [Araneus ventricosus]
MTERRVLKTWSQMEVRAVMSYEWASEASILDIHGRLQSVYGDDVMSRQMVGLWCSMLSEGRQMCHSVTRPFIAHDSTHFHLRPRFEHTSFCHTDLH